MSDIQGHFEYFSDRAQKITEALYRVTDFFSDSEPLKWTLRKEALEILESILKIRSIPPQELSKEISRLDDRIHRSIRILELASSNSFVSETNFNVLKREYSTIKDFLITKKTELAPEVFALSDSSKTSIPSGFPRNKSIKAVDDDALPRPTGPVSAERREKILTYIRGRDWTSVGDLMTIFQGQISDKTIQRDLIGMANEGVLLKEGDKRWRRYKAA